MVRNVIKIFKRQKNEPNTRLFAVLYFRFTVVTFDQFTFLVLVWLPRNLNKNTEKVNSFPLKYNYSLRAMTTDTIQRNKVVDRKQTSNGQTMWFEQRKYLAAPCEMVLSHISGLSLLVHELYRCAIVLHVMTLSLKTGSTLIPLCFRCCIVSLVYCTTVWTS